MRMGNREGGGPGRGKSEKRKVRGKEKPGKRKVRGKEKPGKVGEGKETAEREIWVGGSRREERLTIKEKNSRKYSKNFL